jgi:predicted aspartyl protease
MSFGFNSDRGLVRVIADIFGPSGSISAMLALDTGATGTVLNDAVVTAAGYNIAAASKRVRITTGSGIESAPLIRLAGVSCLGRKKTNFSILCHTLPASAGVDGLLGLDFFRGTTLTIDFVKGRIRLR